MRVLLVTDRDKMNEIRDLVVSANTMQMSDPLFKAELGSWVRFNENDAVSHGDGLCGKCTGNPALPATLGKLIFGLVPRPSPENKKIVQQVKTSAGFAIFVSEKDDPAHWVEAGRCYERFALTATALGIRNAFLNQPVEVKDVRGVLAAKMGLAEAERPDLIVRFGKGPEMPLSPRRPVDSVVKVK